ncbi:SDR family NAD(P)-dependent oxidoreductase [Streptomyces sp. NPDC056660]|uniref:SDR family NAD(P)-dependent oxidoreductase n=1 Tax=Streptomyces sp. NPDC056660 TaxID=3345897 RepID=UPI003691DCE8
MTAQLNGKVALVTGASRGIGAAIAVRLAADGADVAISYARSPERAAATVEAAKATGRRAVAIQCDQADAADAQALVGKVISHFGHLDILVNNAGVFATGTIDEPDRDQSVFDRQFQVNVYGVVATVRAAAGVLSHGGRIVSIATSGAASTRVAMPGIADYVASKSALVAYTKGWARDLGRQGITVNAVQPGPIDTEMNPESGDFAEELASMTALGRYGKPEDIAAAVSYLASPDAGFVTGTVITVDGGLSML